MSLGGGVLVILALQASATPESGPVYQVAPLFDGLLGLGSGMVALLLDVQKLDWNGLSPCESQARRPSEEERLAYDLMDPREGVCDASAIAPIDRWVVDQGFDSAWLFSNILMISMMLTPLAVSLAPADEKLDRLGEAFLVSLETHGLVFLLTSAVKTSLLRPRPLTYSSDFDKEDRYAGDARLSFFSGHSAESFAAASLLTVLLSKQGYESSTVVLASAGAYLGATLVAYFRIAARKHFLTDVAVGALIGTVVGLVVPLLHALPAAESTTVPLGSAGADPGYHPLVVLGGAF